MQTESTQIPTGLPPGPRMPRALQSVIWYRSAQWLMDQCRARFGDMFTLKIANRIRAQCTGKAIHGFTKIAVMSRVVAVL